jgi:hypothetical protein
VVASDTAIMYMKQPWRTAVGLCFRRNGGMEIEYERVQVLVASDTGRYFRGMLYHTPLKSGGVPI